MYYYNLGMYFKEVSYQNSNRVALKYLNHDVTYEKLFDKAKCFAHELVKLNLKKGDVVAIAHTKQEDSYALMLSCLFIGVIYVNIDVDSPVIRNKKILEVCDAKVLFVDDIKYMDALAHLVKNTKISIMQVPSWSKKLKLDDFEIDQFIFKVDGSSVAYIMFTSGSTGVPKGVAVTHQNLLHFIEWGKSYFDIVPEDIFSNLSPMYFDNSVFDFYISLFSGASLAPISKKDLSTPTQLTENVEKLECTIWFSVPSLLIYLMSMKVLTKGRLPKIRSFSFGGEGYPKIELKKLFDFFGSQSNIVNVYGPTECTCICSAYKLTEDDFDNLEGLPALGRLNQNFDYMILNDQNKPSKNGELCLIGPNVAAGYYNDEEKTSKAFITLLQPEYFMKRMYKTGDLVEERNGELYFIGRKDNQIKHMGYRIELEEVEAALLNISSINQAVVIYNRINTNYGKLEAYVASDVILEPQNIMNLLSESIPSYMIPNSVEVMKVLPKNANGKVDRKAFQ